MSVAYEASFVRIPDNHLGISWFGLHAGRAVAESAFRRYR